MAAWAARAPQIEALSCSWNSGFIHQFIIRHEGLLLRPRDDADTYILTQLAKKSAEDAASAARNVLQAIEAGSLYNQEFVVEKERTKEFVGCILVESTISPGVARISFLFERTFRSDGTAGKVLRLITHHFSFAHMGAGLGFGGKMLSCYYTEITENDKGTEALCRIAGMTRDKTLCRIALDDIVIDRSFNG